MRGLLRLRGLDPSFRKKWTQTRRWPKPVAWGSGSPAAAIIACVSALLAAVVKKMLAVSASDLHLDVVGHRVRCALADIAAVSRPVRQRLPSAAIRGQPSPRAHYRAGRTHALGGWGVGPMRQRAG